MNVQRLMHNCSHSIKSYSPVLWNVSPFKNKIVFWQIMMFLRARIFLDTHFSIRISQFLAGILFSHPVNGRKKAECIFHFLKKKVGGRTWFLLLKKRGRQDVVPFEKCKTWTPPLTDNKRNREEKFCWWNSSVKHS